jgi:hypothetical protein
MTTLMQAMLEAHGQPLTAEAPSHAAGRRPAVARCSLPSTTAEVPAMTANSVQERAEPPTATVTAVRAQVLRLQAVAMLPQISPVQTAQARVRQLAYSMVTRAAA